MTRAAVDYKAFEASSTRSRRLLREEELILQVTEALSEAIEQGGITKVELARRLGKTKGFVSQILAGGRNLTLRTIADVADAMECRVQLQVHARNTVRDDIGMLLVSAQRVTIPLERRARPAIRVVGFRRSPVPASTEEIAA